MEQKRKIKLSRRQYYIKYTRNKLPKGLINKEKESKIKENEWLKGVSCFILNENGDVLIEQRANKGLTPGKLDLCSGHVDNFEISFQAMIRELKEELGIDIQRESVKLHQLEPKNCPLVFESNGKNKNFFITFFCLERNSSKVKIQKEEVASIKYIPLKEAFKLIQDGKTKFPSDFDYREIFDQVYNIYKEKSIQNLREAGGR